MALDTNYLYIPDDNKPKLPNPVIRNAYEQMTLSPSVVQITMDYLYVRNQLLDDGAKVETDMGQDLALSIVCDAYNHEAMKRRVQFVQVDNSGNAQPGGYNCNNG